MMVKTAIFILTLCFSSVFADTTYSDGVEQAKNWEEVIKNSLKEKVEVNVNIDEGKFKKIEDVTRVGAVLIFRLSKKESIAVQFPCRMTNRDGHQVDFMIQLEK